MLVLDSEAAAEESESTFGSDPAPETVTPARAGRGGGSDESQYQWALPAPTRSRRRHGARRPGPRPPRLGDASAELLGPMPRPPLAGGVLHRRQAEPGHLWDVGYYY